jgi:hypothetical protein
MQQISAIKDTFRNTLLAGPSCSESLFRIYSYESGWMVFLAITSVMHVAKAFVGCSDSFRSTNQNLHPFIKIDSPDCLKHLGEGADPIRNSSG